MPAHSRLLASALAGFAISFVAASPARSALLQVSGTVHVEIAALPSPSLTGSGSGESVQGGIASHPAFAFPETPSILPTFVGIAELVISGAVLPGGPGGGANGLMGSVVGMGLDGTRAAGFPLSPVGGGGSAVFTVGPAYGSLLGATWQGAAGTATPVVFSTMAGALAIPITATATAYDNRTAAGRGIVQFVAPATGQFEIFGSFPVYGTLTLRYTPEPGTLLLLVSGVASLLVLGRNKMKA